MEGFEPYIIKHGFKDQDFFVATPLGRDWYDPPKPYTMLEYEWVAENIPIQQKCVVEAGSHHGHYSMVLASLQPYRLSLIDPHSSNMDIAEVNLRLNQFLPWQLITGALWNEPGKIHYNGYSNGALISEGGREVDSYLLKDIDSKAQVVKLDIEGAEYAVVPGILKTCNIDSWIIELHAGNTTEENAQDHIAQILHKHKYGLDWVNKETMRVERYKLGTIWPDHSTLFGRR